MPYVCWVFKIVGCVMIGSKWKKRGKQTLEVLLYFVVWFSVVFSISALTKSENNNIDRYSERECVRMHHTCS